MEFVKFFISWKVQQVETLITPVILQRPSPTFAWPLFTRKRPDELPHAQRHTTMEQALVWRQELSRTTTSRPGKEVMKFAGRLRQGQETARWKRLKATDEAATDEPVAMKVRRAEAKYEVKVYFSFR